MVKLALTQLTSLDGVMQSPGPRTSRSSTGAGSWTSTAVPRVTDSSSRSSRTPTPSCSAGSPVRPCGPSGPQLQGEFADRLNELPRYVVSSTLTDPAGNATVLGDDWPEEVARLGKELDGNTVVYGSRRLSQALMGMGLVDELRLMGYPRGARCGIVCSARRRTSSRCA
jgi:hypothetical protein